MLTKATAAIVTVLISLFFALALITAAQQKPTEKPPATTQKPVEKPATPTPIPPKVPSLLEAEALRQKQGDTPKPQPDSPEGIKLQNDLLRQQLQSMAAEILRLREALKTTQSLAPTATPTPAPAAPPVQVAEPVAKEPNAAFFATQYKRLKDAAEQPCKDLRGKFSINIQQAQSGMATATAVCSF